MSCVLGMMLSTLTNSALFELFGFHSFKAISMNEYTQIAQVFCSFSKRKKGGHSASYVTLFTTQKMVKKTTGRVNSSPEIA